MAIRKEVAALIKAKGAYRKAEACYEKAFRKAFPVGCEVVVERGKSVFSAKILRHCYGPLDVVIRNMHTGSEYKICGSCIREFINADELDGGLS